jgi:hypothetical protein
MMTYNDLIKLDNMPRTRNFEGDVKLILKDFMLKNLVADPSIFCDAPPTDSTTKKDKEIHEDSIQKIRHSIINFLYSGQFTLDENGSNNYDYSEKALTKIKANIKPTKYQNPDIFFKPIESSWNKILESYQSYLKALKEKLDKSDEEGKKVKINKIIVYEAPPYNDPKATKYFLNNARSKYFYAIKNCFAPASKLPPIPFLVNYNIGVFDISLASLPLSKEDIRKEWNKDEIFLIGDKQITVVLFEIAFDHFVEKIGINNIAEHPLFAIGAPVNSSAGIFEYYSKNLLKNHSISVDLSITNNTSTYKKRNEPGETFPMYKSNIINSGYPSDILMKNAFNMD